MVTMTNGRMAHILSMATHRAEYPVVRWIEENIKSGKANTDYGTSCVEIMKEVTVRFVMEFAYEVEDGNVISVIHGFKADPYFEDRTKPTEKEIDLLELCDYNAFMVLRQMCFTMLDAFNHPHSCTIDYHIMEEDCSGAGCEKTGPVNYHGGRNWQYYCGGGPRCCP
ncbi:hypothetical protein POP15_226 [Pectobacterium phage POP15]|nr:hypothetical protein POP15_226 [Pectobacterium phage POP15]